MGKANSQTNPKSTNNKFWQFRNLADDDQKAELLLYGDISERSWWEDAATPKRFADDLAALGDVKEITVYINSGGGDVFAAQAIGNMLERNAATVTAHIDGVVCKCCHYRCLPCRQSCGRGRRQLHGPSGQHGRLRLPDRRGYEELPESA